MDATKSTITLMKIPPMYYYFYIKHLEILGDMFSHLQLLYIQHIVGEDILQKKSDSSNWMHRESYKTMKTSINNNKTKD